MMLMIVFWIFNMFLFIGCFNSIIFGGRAFKSFFICKWNCGYRCMCVSISVFKYCFMLLKLCVKFLGWLLIVCMYFFLFFFLNNRTTNFFFDVLFVLCVEYIMIFCICFVFSFLFNKFMFVIWVVMNVMYFVL